MVTRLCPETLFGATMTFDRAGHAVFECEKEDFCSGCEEGSTAGHGSERRLVRVASALELFDAALFSESGKNVSTNVVGEEGVLECRRNMQNLCRWVGSVFVDLLC